jgi:hypothetical protein
MTAAYCRHTVYSSHSSARHLLQGANDELMRKAIVKSRSDEYTAFGAAALLLNLIPVQDTVAVLPS